MPVLRAVSLFTLLAMVTPLAAAAQGAPAAGGVVEIRSYNLKPGTRDQFHKRFVSEALPLLNRANVDVVAYGPSLHDKDSYFLIRAFAGVEERQRSEDAFYGSEAWIKGPRAAVLADIDSYTTIVVRLDAPNVDALRKALAAAR
jgi:hypothetical protein